jgi:tetratricopeptide (TPR) repeat protein
MTGDVHNLRSLIRHEECLLEVTPEAQGAWNMRAGYVGHKYLKLYQNVQDKEDLQRAIDIFDELLLRLPGTDPMRARALFTQSGAYLVMWDVTKDVGYLHVSARQARDSLALLPKDEPERPDLLRQAAHRWCKLHELTQGRECLDTSIALYGELLESLPDNSSDRRRTLKELVQLRSSKALTTAEDEDYRIAQDCYAELLEQMPADDPEKEQFLTDQTILAIKIQLRAEELGLTQGFDPASDDPALLESKEALRKMGFRPHNLSVSEMEDVLTNLRPEDPNRTVVLGALGAAYHELFSTSKGLSHSSRAAECYREGLDLDSIPSRDRKMLTQALSVVLTSMFKVTKLERDLNIAIEALQRTVEVLRATDSLLGNLVLLSSYVHRRYISNHDKADLDLLVEVPQRALVLVPDDEKDKRAGLLSFIGWAYSERARQGEPFRLMNLLCGIVSKLSRSSPNMALVGSLI